VPSRDCQVLDLRERVEDLLSHAAPHHQAGAGSGTGTGAGTGAPAAYTSTAGTAARADLHPEDGDERLATPLTGEGEEGQGHGGGGGAASDRRARAAGLKTRSSPSLSPTSSSNATAALVGQGQGQAPPEPDTGGGGGGSRRSTIGPGTLSTDASFFGYALEGLAARDGGAGRARAGMAAGDGQGDAEDLGWWKRDGWREKPGAAAAAAENQERLGSLYSMIARR